MPVVYVSVVQFVFPIISQEIFQAGAHQLLVVGLGAQGPADQRGRSIPDVAGNHVVGQFGALHMPQRGIDRMHQVEAGVDQRAVKIENQQSNSMRIERAVEFDGTSIVSINDEIGRRASLGSRVGN